MSEPYSLAEKVRFGGLDAMQHMNNVQFLLYREDIRTRVRPLKIGNASIHLAFEMHALPDERLVAEGYGVLVG